MIFLIKFIGLKIILIKTLLFSNGYFNKHIFIFIHNNNASYCSPFKVKVVDTSGAGDAFMAGLIFATLNNYSLNYSMIFSAACAANNIQHVGASGNVPYFNKVEKFIKYHSKQLYKS